MTRRYFIVRVIAFLFAKYANNIRIRDVKLCIATVLIGNFFSLKRKHKQT